MIRGWSDVLRARDLPPIARAPSVVEGRPLDTVRHVRYSTHWKCLLALVTTMTSNTVIVPAQEAFSADTRLRSAATHRWIEAKASAP